MVELGYSVVEAGLGACSDSVDGAAESDGITEAVEEPSTLYGAEGADALKGTYRPSSGDEISGDYC